MIGQCPIGAIPIREAADPGARLRRSISRARASLHTPPLLFVLRRLTLAISFHASSRYGFPHLVELYVEIQRKPFAER